MAKIGIIACSKSKLPYRALAEDFYTSPVFRLRKKLVQRTCDAWYIASAKGLLRPTDMIKPYDCWLRHTSKFERERVQKEIATAILEFLPTTVVLYVGEHYHSPILADALRKECMVEIPHEGLSLCYTLQALKLAVSSA